MACSFGARWPSELCGRSQASRPHVAGKDRGHTRTSMRRRTAQAVAAASSRPQTQPRLVAEGRDADRKGSVKSTHGEEPLCCEQQQDVAGVVVGRRALGQCCLAAALASVTAGPRPSHAALVEDDVSMRVFDKASPSVVSIVNYSSKVRVSPHYAVPCMQACAASNTCKCQRAVATCGLSSRCC
eukprot:366406-Chlamydomonas_euryale.AAC.13